MDSKDRLQISSSGDVLQTLLLMIILVRINIGGHGEFVSFYLDQQFPPCSVIALQFDR